MKFKSGDKVFYDGDYWIVDHYLNDGFSIQICSSKWFVCIVVKEVEL
jgi:hypothetical protein